MIEWDHRKTNEMEATETVVLVMECGGRMDGKCIFGVRVGQTER